ncbi:hypothetical protein OROHE_008281 [Orobanche hederae]
MEICSLSWILLPLTTLSVILNCECTKFPQKELAGTCIYLDILQKTTSTVDIQKEESIKEIEGIAEGKLVSFCAQVLREASEFQSSMEETLMWMFIDS